MISPTNLVDDEFINFSWNLIKVIHQHILRLWHILFFHQISLYSCLHIAQLPSFVTLSLCNSFFVYSLAIFSTIFLNKTRKASTESPLCLWKFLFQISFIIPA